MRTLGNRYIDKRKLTSLHDLILVFEVHWNGDLHVGKVRIVDSFITGPRDTGETYKVLIPIKLTEETLILEKEDLKIIDYSWDRNSYVCELI